MDGGEMKNNKGFERLIPEAISLVGKKSNHNVLTRNMKNAGKLLPNGKWELEKQQNYDGIFTAGFPIGLINHVTAGRWEEERNRDVWIYARSKGNMFLWIDYKGNLFQDSYLDEIGIHGNGANSKYIGVEHLLCGTLKKCKTGPSAGKYFQWFDMGKDGQPKIGAKIFKPFEMNEVTPVKSYKPGHPRYGGVYQVLSREQLRRNLWLHLKLWQLGKGVFNPLDIKNTHDYWSKLRSDIGGALFIPIKQYYEEIIGPAMQDTEFCLCDNFHEKIWVKYFESNSDYQKQYGEWEKNSGPMLPWIADCNKEYKFFK